MLTATGAPVGAAAAAGSVRARPPYATATARPGIRLSVTVLLDLELPLHPGMDQAHEVQRRALLGGHVERDRVALVLPDQGRVTGLVHLGRRALPDAVLEEVELRRRLAVGIRAMGLAELLADLAAAQDLGRRARQVLLGDDAQGVRASLPALLTTLTVPPDFT